MTGDTRFPALFSEYRIGSVAVRNRVVVAPHSTHYSERVESARHTEYYARRAAGGVGLIIHEPVIVHPSSRSRPGKVWGYDPENVAHFARTTGAVHAEGAAMFCQLIHNGRTMDSHTSGLPAWGPSAVQRAGSPDRCHAMTGRDIAEVVDGFAAAAAICEQGGFDGVEIHAAHGYLLQTFLSPASNHRTDQYGGSTANRLRILDEVIAATRDRVGREFVVGVRLAGDEVLPGGLGAEEMTDIAGQLARSVDYLSIVSGHTGSFERIVPDMSFPRGLNVDLARQIKQRVGPLPVLVTGRIAEPAEAERIIATGAADLVGLARPLIADPAWAAKARAGEHHDIRPCTYANECRDSISGRRSLTCMVNPDNGRAATDPTPSTATVLIVGGGLAGLECAVSAAARGCRVTLVEATEELGGQARLAASAPTRAELGRIGTHLAEQVRRAGIRLELGRPVTADWIAAQAADVVVLATGARPARPALADEPHVLTARAVLADPARVTGSVAVYDEAASNSWAFWSTVEALAAAHRPVTALLPYPNVGTGIEGSSLPPLLRRLAAAGVEIRTGVRVTGRDEDRVLLAEIYSGRPAELTGIDTLVCESGATANDELADDLATRVARVELIGDALAPRRIMDAIREGRQLAQRI